MLQWWPLPWYAVPWLTALCGGLVGGRVGDGVLLGHGALHGLAVHTLVPAIQSHCTLYLATISWLPILERKCRHGEHGAKFAHQVSFSLFQSPI